MTELFSLVLLNSHILIKLSLIYNFKKFFKEKKFIADKIQEKTWLREGDRNTKYFHSSVKMKRASNFINWIKNFSHGILAVREDIEEEAVPSFLHYLHLQTTYQMMFRKKLRKCYRVFHFQSQIKTI